MALAVPLSRFTSRVGGGSAFFVRRQTTRMEIKTTLPEADVEQILAVVRSQTDEPIRSLVDGELGQRSRPEDFMVMFGRFAEQHQVGRFYLSISGHLDF